MCRRGYLFFFNDTATTEIYTLSLHDALPICVAGARLDDVGVERPLHEEAGVRQLVRLALEDADELAADRLDRKSTRLNSSHANISYAVFCLKKQKSSSFSSSHSTVPLHRLRY